MQENARSKVASLKYSNHLPFGATRFYGFVPQVSIVAAATECSERKLRCYGAMDDGAARQ
jgi:hypothetical protein